jgi:hypothetical protein
MVLRPTEIVLRENEVAEVHELLVKSCNQSPRTYSEAS